MDIQKLQQLPPCPIYDMAGMERWLSAMAREGWLVTEQSIWGYFVFQKAAPQAVHFRLEVVVNPQSAWDGDPKTPREEALALHEEFGWFFVMRCGEFFLYQNTAPVPRELHTDPEVQALTLKMLNKRLRNNLLSSLLVIAFHILFGIFAYPFAITLVMGTAFLVLLAILTLWGLAGQLLTLLHIRQLRKALLRSAEPPRQKDWCKHAGLYRGSRILSFVLTVVFLVTLYGICIHRKLTKPLSEYTGTVPFVTLEELLPEDGSVTLDKIDNSTYQTWSSLLYPVVWDYLDGGTASHHDGTGTGGLLEVQYCQARSSWLALGAARDFTRFYTRQAKLYDSIGEFRPLPELGLDYAVGFYNQFGLIRVILAEGDTAICARFTMDDGEGITIEHWAQRMAQLLKAQAA